MLKLNILEEDLAFVYKVPMCIYMHPESMKKQCVDYVHPTVYTPVGIRWKKKISVSLEMPHLVTSARCHSCRCKLPAFTENKSLSGCFVATSVNPSLMITCFPPQKSECVLLWLFSPFCLFILPDALPPLGSFCTCDSFSFLMDG